VQQNYFAFFFNYYNYWTFLIQNTI